MPERPVSAGFVRILSLCLVTALLVPPARAQYGGGAGTPESPYLIFTAGQFHALGASPYDWDKHFKLMADLVLSSYGPSGPPTIGTADDGPFTGGFDGNHKILSGLRRSSDYARYLGLFGAVDGSQTRIRNIILRDPSVVSETGYYVGALVGWLREGTIENCHIRGGVVQAESFVGGLIGWSEGGKISGCTAEAVVHGSSRVGGLIGECYFGRIERCLTDGETFGPAGAYWVGGLIGHNRDATVRECRAGGVVQGTSWVGGLIGESLTAPIERCSATGTVVGQEVVGGLLGQNSGGTVSDSYATARVTGVLKVGGLAGGNGPNCECSVYTPGVILRCYASGPVAGQTRGGLLGAAGKSETHQSFWDIETTGCAWSADGADGTTTDLNNLATYLAAGWDFVAETQNGTQDIWCLPAGGCYPRLAWELAAADFNGDGRIDLRDFSRLAMGWQRADAGLGSGGVLVATDGGVDVGDLMDFVRLWLAGCR